jgi:hypothetical protein
VAGAEAVPVPTGMRLGLRYFGESCRGREQCPPPARLSEIAEKLASEASPDPEPDQNRGADRAVTAEDRLAFLGQQPAEVLVFDLA